MPDMDHIGCEATDWLLEAFGLPVKDFGLGVSVAILDGASVFQILKGVGVIIVLKMNNNEAILFFL